MHPKNLLPILLCMACFFTVFITGSQPQDPVQKLYVEFQTAINGGNAIAIEQAGKKALRLLQNEKALTVRQRAIAYTIAGAAEVSAFKLKEALAHLQKALQFCEDGYGKESPETFDAKRYLSWAYGYMSDFALERRYSFELLDYYKKDEAKYAIEIADLYHTIGMNYGLKGKSGSSAKGDIANEQAYYNLGRKTLEGYRPPTPAKELEKQYNLLNIYNSLGVSYNTTENYDYSRHYAEKSLALREKLTPGSTQRAINWMIIGKDVFQTEGKADSALPHLARAVALLEKDSLKGTPPWVNYKGYQAEMMIKGGKLDEAITEIKTVLKEMQQSPSPNPVLFAGLVQNHALLARAYTESGDYKKAVATCEAVREKAEKTMGATHIAVLNLCAQYATALSLNGDWQKAAAEFDTVVNRTGITTTSLKDSSGNIPVAVPSEFLDIYRQAGNSYVRSGFANKSNADVLTGIAVLKKLRRELERRNTWYFEAGIDEGTGTQDLPVYEGLLEALYRAKGIVPEGERLAAAFGAIESSKAALLKNKLSEENRLSRMLPQDVDRKRLDLKAKLLVAMNNVRQQNSEAFRDSLLQSKEEYMNYVRRIKQQYGIAETKENEEATATDPFLRQHEGVIANYFLGEKQLYIFLHEAGRQRFLQKEIPRHFENDLGFVRTFCLTKDAWSKPGNNDTLRRIARDWYRWLLGDADTAGELVVIPHRQLALISFEMLDRSAAAAKTSYVVESRPVRYELSAGMMRRSGGHEEKAEAFFGGFAASEFDRSGNQAIAAQAPLTEAERGSIETLPGTTREIKQLAEITGGDAFLNAQPATFLQHAAAYKIVHVAAHAFANQGRYHECKLLFEADSNGNNTVSDVEIASLPLKAGLTVLSACNTGLGQVHNSEGLLSLGRSFFLAGSSSVVMSLWTVNDASTATIMAAFYRHLQSGEPKSEALRNAKLDYLKSETNPARKHPYYWAGFVVMGDDAPLTSTSATSGRTVWIVVGILITALASLLFYWRKRSNSSLA